MWNSQLSCVAGKQSLKWEIVRDKTSEAGNYIFKASIKLGTISGFIQQGRKAQEGCKLVSAGLPWAAHEGRCDGNELGGGKARQMVQTPRKEVIHCKGQKFRMRAAVVMLGIMDRFKKHLGGKISRSW